MCCSFMQWRKVAVAVGATGGACLVVLSVHHEGMVTKMAERMKVVHTLSERLRSIVVEEKALSGGDRSLKPYVDVVESVGVLLERADERQGALDSAETLDAVASAFQRFVGSSRPVVGSSDLSVHLLTDVRV
jgi:hypothetical protein